MTLHVMFQRSTRGESCSAVALSLSLGKSFSSQASVSICRMRAHQSPSAAHISGPQVSVTNKPLGMRFGEFTLDIHAAQC